MLMPFTELDMYIGWRTLESAMLDCTLALAVFSERKEEFCLEKGKFYCIGDDGRMQICHILRKYVLSSIRTE